MCVVRVYVIDEASGGGDALTRGRRAGHEG